MAPTADVIRKTVEKYVQAVAHGTVDDVLALYAKGATVEDPVGTEVKTTEASIREFYAVVEPMEQTGVVLTLRIAASTAAFHFKLTTKFGDKMLEISPIDVMEFDDEGKITSMRAIWGQEDMVQIP